MKKNPCLHCRQENGLLAVGNTVSGRALERSVTKEERVCWVEREKSKSCCTKTERGQNPKIDDGLFLLSLQFALDQNAEKALHTRTKKRVLRTSDLPVHHSCRGLG